MLEYINGENKKPEAADSAKLTDEETKAAKLWRTTNDRIITLLMNSMKPAVSDIFMMTETAHELWEAIKVIYGQQKKFSHIYQLYTGNSTRKTRVKKQY